MVGVADEGVEGVLQGTEERVAVVVPGLETGMGRS